MAKAGAKAGAVAVGGPLPAAVPAIAPAVGPAMLAAVGLPAAVPPPPAVGLPAAVPPPVAIPGGGPPLAAIPGGGPQFLSETTRGSARRLEFSFNTCLYADTVTPDGKKNGKKLIYPPSGYDHPDSFNESPRVKFRQPSVCANAQSTHTATPGRSPSSGPQN